jgi:uncharacterized RDD family membrane protein YckC
MLSSPPHIHAPVYHLASWPARLGALIIDWVIVFAFSFMVASVMVLFGYEALASMEVEGSTMDAVSQLTSMVAFFVYRWLLMRRKGARNGQTWGKQLVGIKVVRDSGEDIGVGTVVLREVIGKFVSGIICGIGYLFPLWDESKRALHDMVASTHVIITDSKGNANAPVQPAYLQPGYPQGGQSPLTTLSALTVGGQGFVAPSSLSIDNQRGSWIDPHAPVAQLQDQQYSIGVQVLGDGYYLSIPSALTGLVATTAASPQSYSESGWSVVKDVKLV